MKEEKFWYYVGLLKNPIFKGGSRKTNNREEFGVGGGRLGQFLDLDLRGEGVDAYWKLILPDRTW